MIPESSFDWRKGSALLGALFIVGFLSHRVSLSWFNKSHPFPSSPSLPLTAQGLKRPVAHAKKPVYGKSRLATFSKPTLNRPYWHDYRFRFEGRLMQGEEAVPNHRVSIFWHTDHNSSVVSRRTDADGRFVVDAGFRGRVNGVFDWETLIDDSGDVSSPAIGRRILTRDDHNVVISLDHLRLPVH